MASSAEPRPARRAPRLAPSESIAGLFTRTGRFREIDPTVPRSLPRWPQVLGVVAWLGFTAGVGMAAWRRHRGDPADARSAGEEPC